MTDVLIELPHPVSVENLPDHEKVIKIKANAEQCVALAARYQVLGVQGLQATVRLTRMAKRMVHLDATYEAQLTQQCVVTLQPFETTVSGHFERDYSPDAEEDAPTVVNLDDNLPEPPDPIIDGVIDVGEAVCEEVALNIDLFPKQKDATLNTPKGAENGGQEAPAPANPFASLAALKDKLERGN